MFSSFIAISILCLVCILSSVLFIPSVNLKSDSVNNQIARPSDFPEFDGDDARMVIIDIGAKYPRYTPEIMSEDAAPVSATDYDENRVRIYVNRSGIVQKSIIG